MCSLEDCPISEYVIVLAECNWVNVVNQGLNLFPLCCREAASPAPLSSPNIDLGVFRGFFL